MGGGLGPLGPGEKWKLEMEFTGGISDEQAKLFNAALNLALKLIADKGKITFSQKELP